MQDVYEVFENFSKVIGNISKKAYRNCAVLMTGAAVVALISFNSKEFGGCGKNKTDLVKRQNSGIVIKEEESSEEEIISQTEEIVSVSARDTEVFVKKSGQTEDTITIEKTETELTVHELTPEVPEEINEIPKESENLTVEAEAVKAAEPECMVAEPTPEEIEIEETVEVAALKEKTGNTQRVICLDETNYQVLLRIVEAEASGEGLTGKKLVANVILNRVNHSSFPDTVEAVVFERSGGHVQFSPTADGRFESVTISEETIQAVEAVLCGEDNSQGALFFSARSKADPDNMSWFDRNLKWLFAHGGHEFYTLP